MRILHLSDVHYCETKQDDFIEYREKLLEELKKIHEQKPVDFVLLTGDLLNRGGSNFSENKGQCYKVFEDEVILPVVTVLGIPKGRLLFIPGNHDVDDVTDSDYSEKGLVNFNIREINKLVVDHRNHFVEANQRIRKYKDFENTYYKGHPQSQLSNFESCWVEDFNGLKIGFAGLNSAWRCSTKLTQGKLIIGAERQLIQAKRFFEKNKTDFNIALLHHPIEQIAEIERPELEKYLHDAKISLLFGGHNHRVSVFQKVRDEIFLFQTLSRMAFTDKREENEPYQAGFTIVDLNSNIFNPDHLGIQCTFYKYVNSILGFDMDVLGGKGGKASYSIPTKSYSSKFLSYLKSIEPATSKNEIIAEAHKKAKQELIALWNKLTISIIRSSFTSISEKLANNIRNTMLLDNEQFYNTNNVFTYSIRDYDINHFELTEEHSFVINTDNDSINFSRTFVVEKFKGQEDKSDIIIDKLTVDTADYSSSVISLPPEDSPDPRTIRIKKSFNIVLQSKKRYNVVLITRSIHSQALNGYWRKYFSEITEGVMVNPPENPDYEVDTLNFAKGMNIHKGFIPLGNVGSQDPVLFMPGDGFALILKRKANQ